MNVLTESTRSFFFFSFFLESENDDDTTWLSIQACTMELRAAMGARIRVVFYPISNTRDDYDQDYLTKIPCLKLRDVYLNSFSLHFFFNIFSI